MEELNPSVFEWWVLFMHKVKRYIDFNIFKRRYKYGFELGHLDSSWHIIHRTNILTIKYDLTDDQKLWLSQNIGERGVLWEFFQERYDWNGGSTFRIGFHDEDSAAAFKLRWTE